MHAKGIVLVFCGFISYFGDVQGTKNETITTELASGIGRVKNIDVWPKHIVPYTLSVNNDRPFVKKDMQVFKATKLFFESHTCLRVLPKKKADLKFVAITFLRGKFECTIVIKGKVIRPCLMDPRKLNALNRCK